MPSFAEIIAGLKKRKDNTMPSFAMGSAYSPELDTSKAPPQMGPNAPAI